MKCSAFILMISLVFIVWPAGAMTVIEKQKLATQYYMKYLKLNEKDTTMGFYWKNVRHVYPIEYRNLMDHWVSAHRHEKMPKIDMLTYKNKEGVEQLRMVITRNGESITVSMNPRDSIVAKVGNVELTANDVNQAGPVLEKLYLDPQIKKNLERSSEFYSGFSLTRQEYKALTLEERIQYLSLLRKMTESMDSVTQIEASSESTSSFFIRWLMGKNAEAFKNGTRCVVAGFISQFENNKCGGSDFKKQVQNLSLQCQKNSIPCNPLLYGYKDDGNPYCVSSSEVAYATKKCSKMSPLNNDQDKKRILESVYKKEYGSFDFNMKEGSLPDTEYPLVKDHLDKMEKLVIDSYQVCNNNLQKNSYQKSACQEMARRQIQVEKFVVQNTGGALIDKSIVVGDTKVAETEESAIIEVGTVISAVPSETTGVRAADGSAATSAAIAMPPSNTVVNFTAQPSSSALTSSTALTVTTPTTAPSTPTVTTPPPSTTKTDAEIFPHSQSSTAGKDSKSFKKEKISCGWWCKNSIPLMATTLFMGLSWWTQKEAHKQTLAYNNQMMAFLHPSTTSTSTTSTVTTPEAPPIPVSPVVPPPVTAKVSEKSVFEQVFGSPAAR